MKREKESKTRKRNQILDRNQAKRLDKAFEKTNLAWRTEERTKEREKAGNQKGERKVQRKRTEVDGSVEGGKTFGGMRMASQRKNLSESGRKNLERSLERQGREGDTGKKEKEIRGKRKKRRRNQRARREEKAGEESAKEKTRPVREWKEQIARVGTGYRVRKDEKDPTRRRFDVGYSDRKVYKRKEGRDARIDQSNMGRTLVGKGENARVKVMNAVCQIEKRRQVSDYTGSGIRRKSRVGKRKLKPTKPQSKS